MNIGGEAPIEAPAESSASLGPVAVLPIPGADANSPPILTFGDLFNAVRAAANPIRPGGMSVGDQPAESASLDASAFDDGSMQASANGVTTISHHPDSSVSSLLSVIEDPLHKGVSGA